MIDNIGGIEFEIFHSDNSHYGTEWKGLRLNDDYHRLYFVLDGAAEVIYNGNVRQITQGNTYLFPTTTSFKYSCPDKLQLLNVCFKMTLLDNLDVLTLHPWAVEVQCADIARTRVKMEKIDALTHKETFSHQIALRGHILTLLAPHFRAKETDRDRKKRRDAERLAPVIQFISDNIKSGITIGELPDVARMSRAYFSKVFHATFEVSPQDYVRRQRVELVKRELRLTGTPVAILAEDFGFSSASHLTREFKSHTGYSPKQYRELDSVYD